VRRAQPAVPASPLSRRLAVLLLLLVAALAAAPAGAARAPSVAGAQGGDATPPRSPDAPRNLTGVAVEGSDRVVVGLPEADTDDDGEADVPAAPGLTAYKNAGYGLRLGAGATVGEARAVIDVELTPLGSAAPFKFPAAGDDAEATAVEGAAAATEGEVADPEVAALAREITAKSATLYGAVSSVLGWIVRNVVTDETAALVPPVGTGGEAPTPLAALGEDEAADEAADENSIAAPLSQTPAAVLARGSGDAAGIAGLAVALFRAVGIEARTVHGQVVGTPAVGGPWGPHTWVEVRYPDVGWVFSDPLHYHHYVPATYLRLPSAAAETLPSEPLPAAAGEAETAGAGSTLQPTYGPTFELVERRDLRQTVDHYPLGGPGVTARKNLAVQRAAALRVVVSEARRGSAVLEGSDGRTSRILVDGESVFVGLATGSYRLEVYLEDQPPIVRQLDLAPRERRAVFLRREAEAAERKRDGGGGADLPPPDHYRVHQPTASRNTP